MIGLPILQILAVAVKGGTVGVGWKNCRWYNGRMAARELSIETDGGFVSGLWLKPANATACLVLAHGAGAGMMHRSMVALAEGLDQRGIATLRFQFPYMQHGARRP